MSEGGLSPLARGTRNSGPSQSRVTRFIPAGAGNTGSSGVPLMSKPVYPRWRGEHGEAKLPPALTTGLSPLARGTLFLQIFENILKRFIPAGAGNTRL